MTHFSFDIVWRNFYVALIVSRRQNEAALKAIPSTPGVWWKAAVNKVRPMSKALQTFPAAPLLLG
jgi:hypothetical protein